MKLLFAATALVLLFAAATESQQDPINQPVFINRAGNGEITVTVPYVSRKQLNELVGQFFAGENKRPSEEMVHRIAEASEVTLIITTKKLEERKKGAK